MNSFDPQRLALGRTRITVSPRRLPLRHKVGEKFIQGPIPMTWVQRAAALPGKAFHLGMALWFMAGMTKNRRVRVTHKLASQFSVGRKAIARCLKQLQGAGLASVEQRAGRSPEVTILEANPGIAPSDGAI